MLQLPEKLTSYLNEATKQGIAKGFKEKPYDAMVSVAMGNVLSEDSVIITQIVIGLLLTLNRRGLLAEATTGDKVFTQPLTFVADSIDATNNLEDAIETFKRLLTDDVTYRSIAHLLAHLWTIQLNNHKDETQN